MSKIKKEKSILDAFIEANAIKLKPDIAEKIQRLQEAVFSGDVDKATQILDEFTKKEMEYIKELDPSIFAAIDRIASHKLGIIKK